MARNQTTAAAFLLLSALLWLLLPARSFAQSGAMTGGFRTVLEYYPPPHERQEKTVLSGREAKPQANGTVQLTQLKIESFRENGDREMTVESPDCIFDSRTSSVNSAAPLQIHSGDGKFLVKGAGFLWRQVETNSVLTISNNIETTIEKALLAQSNTNGTSANPPAGTNQLIHIWSDNFSFDRNANLIIYRQNTRVEDEQGEITCDVLTIQRTGTNTIENIVADGHVVVIDKAGGRATGDHAVYATVDGVQLITLTGNPHWQDGPNEATAKTFVFDHSHDILRTEGNAYLKLLRESASGGAGILLAPQPAPTTNAPGATTNFVEIYSDAMTFQLAPGNGPVQSILAEKNVLIFDPDPVQKSRASGERAFYTQTNGVLELTGNAIWQVEQASGRGLARGGILIFDRTNNAFTARTNAYLKFPAAALGQTAPADSASGTTNQSTNQFVEVSAESYDYRNDVLVFHGPVQSAFLEGETILGTLECNNSLTARFSSNVLQSVLAESDVHARQLPATNSPGHTLERLLNSGRLLVQLRTNKLVSQITAQQDVHATQIETRTNRPAPQVSTLTSDTLDVFFLPNTNAVDHAVAEKNVVMTAEDGKAWGAKAVYTAANDTLVLTGSPKIENTNGWETAEDAIIYNRKTGESTAQGHPHAQFALDDQKKTNAPPATLQKAPE